MRYHGADSRAVALRLIAECRDAQSAKLDLCDLQLTLLEADVVAGLTSLTSLTSLDLGYNEVGPDGAEALKGLTRLTSLGLWNNTIGDRGVQALAGLTSLTSLHLGDNDITDAGVWALRDLTNLTELSLWKNAIGPDGAQALKGLTALTNLDLQGNDIGPDGAQAMKGLTALTWLNITDTNIGDDGVRALKDLTNLTRLEHSGNAITDNGARALTGLTALTWLDLCGNQIGDDGAQALTALTSLTYLDLSINQIGDRGALALLGLPSLTGLDLEQNRLGDDVAQEVKRVMSPRIPEPAVDPTTPEELLALARHLAADPKLDAIFRRVGLHKPFNRPDEYALVLASRRAFAPHLEDRPCSSDNLPVAQALARRLHAGNISSDADALAFVVDRIRHDPNEFEGRSRLLEFEVKDMMRNLLETAFFREFEDCRQRKAEVIKTGIDPYQNIVGFVGDQLWLYGLGGRGWSRV